MIVASRHVPVSPWDQYERLTLHPFGATFPSKPNTEPRRRSVLVGVTDPR